MSCPETHEFGRVLVREVRDAAIQECDRELRPDAKDVIAERWRKAIKDGGIGPAMEVLIPDIVDQTVCELLRALDHGIIRLTFTAANGKKIDLTKDGLSELVGWYAGEWCMEYSKERYIDDLPQYRTWPPPPLPEAARRVLDRKDPPAGT